MPENRPPPRLSLRFAAFGLLAGLMVLLPLGEVLRYQTDEIQVLRAERALLDPLAHAVRLQRNLVGHGEVAARVLAGRRQLEVERRLRKSEVDVALLELRGTLSAGLWVRALDEADELGQDWKLLAGRIQAGQMDAAASQHGHRLLVEQALQVMDLVSAGVDASGMVAGQVHPAAGAILHQRGRAAATDLPGLALEQAHASLAARSLQLNARLGRLKAARSHQVAACAGVLLLLASLLAAVMHRNRIAGDAPDGGAEGGHRRGHGRRNTDAPTGVGDAACVIRQLREAEPQPSAADQATLPPRP